MTSLHARMFKQALSEKLAFTPPPQAPGPGGAPVGPGGPPPGAMDGMAGGPPPGDPAAGGAPPADPAAGGTPPMPPGDPAAAAPPADPAAGGAPPMDPAMLAQLAGGAPGGSADPQVPVSAMKDFAVSLIEAMKGKKTQEALAAEAKGEKAPEEPGAAGGPITGLPGLDAGALQGPIKMGSATLGILFRSKTASVLLKRAGDVAPTAGQVESSIRNSAGGGVTRAINQMAAGQDVPGAAKWNPRGVPGESDATILGNLSRGLAHAYPRLDPALKGQVQKNLTQHPPTYIQPNTVAPTAGPKDPGDYQDPGLAGQKPTF